MSSAEAEPAAGSQKFTDPNSKAVLRSFEAFNRNDTEGVLAEYTEDVEYHNLPEVDGGQIYSGYAGLRSWLANVRAIGGDAMRFDPTILASKGEIVVAEGHGKNIGQGSRTPTEWTAWAVYDMRGGKISRVRMFFSLPEAEAASGLSASE